MLIAEIVLTAVDRALESKLGRVVGCRYIDDYELSFAGLAEAEAALHELQSILVEYELALNPAKIRTLELPQPLDQLWSSEFRSYNFRGAGRSQRSDLINFFGRAFELRQKYRDDAVLSFAIARMRSVPITRANWGLFQALLLQCASAEPGSLVFVLEQLIKYHQAGFRISLQTLEEVLNTHVERHSPLGHGSEVAWALWGLMAFQLPLHAATAGAVSKMEDSVVALLALDADRRGLVKGMLDTQSWLSQMSADNLYGEHWLLSYEANVKGWLPSAGGTIGYVALE